MYWLLTGLNDPLRATTDQQLVQFWNLFSIKDNTDISGNQLQVKKKP